MLWWWWWWWFCAIAIMIMSMMMMMMLCYGNDDDVNDDDTVVWWCWCRWWWFCYDEDDLCDDDDDDDNDLHGEETLLRRYVCISLLCYSLIIFSRVGCHHTKWWVRNMIYHISLLNFFNSFVYFYSEVNRVKSISKLNFVS